MPPCRVRWRCLFSYAPLAAVPLPFARPRPRTRASGHRSLAMPPLKRLDAIAARARCPPTTDTAAWQAHERAHSAPWRGHPSTWLLTRRRRARAAACGRRSPYPIARAPRGNLACFVNAARAHVPRYRGLAAARAPPRSRTVNTEAAMLRTMRRAGATRPQRATGRSSWVLSRFFLWGSCTGQSGGDSFCLAVARESNRGAWTWVGVPAYPKRDAAYVLGDAREGTRAYVRG